MPWYRRSSKFMLRSFVAMTIFAILLTACDPSETIPISNHTPTPAPPAASPTPPAPLVETLFTVHLPTRTLANQPVIFELLDEITGLALNPLRYPMTQKDLFTYTARLQFPAGSLIKYRYLRGSSPPAIEYTTRGQQVRYRVYQANASSAVEDIIAGWNDLAYEGPSGKIEGTISDASSGAPLPAMLVLSGGMQCLSRSDGSFVLDGLAPGTHQISVISMDGSYRPFQQGAVISANSTTPAPIRLDAARFVNVTFNARLPKLTARNAPLRLVGNLRALGDTFADLRGGVSVLASRAPELQAQPDGRYSLTLSLPVGMDLRYKYSLGDGFWNAEHNNDGSFRVRQVLVPDHDLVLDDTVDTWISGNSAPISFTVKVPNTTDPKDSISIQFNPYGWTEPVPMWPAGNNQWLYVLYSPLNMLGNVGYRYCRNEQCGIADDQETRGSRTSGWPFSTSFLSQSFQDDVTRWAWTVPGSQAVQVDTYDVAPKGAAFTAGIEILGQYHPSWQGYWKPALQNLRGCEANLAILSPTWTYTSVNPPVLETLPGRDGLWPDWMVAAENARDEGISLGLFPGAVSASSANSFWQSARRDGAWWQSWFEAYRDFLMHHADLAKASGAKMLILGGAEVLPSLPNGVLPDGTPSGVPGDAEGRWRSMITDVRARYDGLLVWALPYPQSTSLPPFIGMFDQIYLLWSAPLSSEPSPKLADLIREFSRLLDEQVHPLVQPANKPVILGISYPSVDGAARGCVQSSNECLPFEQIWTANWDALPAVDLQEQTQLYTAALIAANRQNWIGGFVSRGYYPPAALQDKSPSIHGKPAWDVLKYWFSRLPGGL